MTDGFVLCTCLNIIMQNENIHLRLHLKSSQLLLNQIVHHCLGSRKTQHFFSYVKSLATVSTNTLFTFYKLSFSANKFDTNLKKNSSVSSC